MSLVKFILCCLALLACSSFYAHFLLEKHDSSLVEHKEVDAAFTQKSSSIYETKKLRGGPKAGEIVVRNTTSRRDDDSIQKWHTVAGSSAFEPSWCPPEPDASYPVEYPILDVTANWNPDDVNIPPKHYASLCRFHYEKELDKAMAYRKAEVPFLVYGEPKMEQTVERWADPHYLPSMLGSKSYLTEYSKDNHFMYWNGRKPSDAPKDWEPPYEKHKMPFAEWRDYADKHSNSSSETPHLYFRTDSFEAHFLRDDLSMLTPPSPLFIVEKNGAKGIFCRFGMGGVNAGAHFDGSRNFVAVMGGYRRYYIANPGQCENTYLWPSGHPSGRHSEVDWSAPDLERYPKFKDAKVTEVILTAGDLMYIPSGWLHYVMSLNTNFQCNARSGKSRGFQEHKLRKCGFHT